MGIVLITILVQIVVGRDKFSRVTKSETIANGIAGLGGNGHVVTDVLHGNVTSL